MVQPLWKTVWSFLKKLKIELSYDSAISLLGVYPKKMKTVTSIYICTPMFIAIFMKAKAWKWPGCPPVGWMDKEKKLWYRDMSHTHTGILSSHKKEGNLAIWDSMDELSMGDEHAVGWPKSLLGFFHNILWKTWMNILANSIK